MSNEEDIAHLVISFWFLWGLIEVVGDSFEIVIVFGVGAVDSQENIVESWEVEVGFDVLDGSVGVSDAVFEEKNVIAKAFDFVHVVGNKNNSCSLFVEFMDNLHEEAAIYGVEAFGWFVENKEVGIVHDSDAELDFLLHTLGKLVDL